ncbi:MAG: hypothetical protein DDT29_02215 [Dehalococcoidia bacterium]|nr:hypothetical protein [Bacillota bacterium]
MEIEKMDKLIAACGLYCGGCSYYYAKGSKKSQCPGCWESDGGCEIRECAQSRSLRLCTFCSDFPCSKLYPESVKLADTLPCVSYLRSAILECVKAIEDFHPGGENAF